MTAESNGSGGKRAFARQANDAACAGAGKPRMRRKAETHSRQVEQRDKVS